MDFSKYTFDFDTHRKKEIILIGFAFNSQLKNDLKKRFPSVKWSQSKKSWYLPNLPVIRRELNLNVAPNTPKKAVRVLAVNKSAYAKMDNQLSLKAYSDNTKRMYLAEFTHLLLLLQDFPVDDLTPERLKDYFLFCVQKEKMKERKMNGKINAVKFYFEQVLHRPKMFFDIPRPKKPQTLPKMLSKNEVKRLFSVVNNQKHLVALKLCYGMGLKVSEVVCLKWEHFDKDRMMVSVVGAKGKKDRYVPMPTSILPMLKNYYKIYKTKDFVLEGQYGGAYSKSSLQQVFKKAMHKAGIHKKIGIHGLRHSYATHLLESGADMRFIQEL